MDREKISDQDNVVFEKKISVDEESNVSSVMDMVDEMLDDNDEEVKVTYIQSDGQQKEGESAVDALQQDIDLREQSDLESDQEVLDMFNELSKGKGFITEKALRKWDELAELVEAGSVYLCMGLWIYAVYMYRCMYCL